MLLTLALLAASTLAAGPIGGPGVIEGAVVRAPDQTPVAGAEVILRARFDGQFVPLAETTSDSQGHFRFEHLAVDGTREYLPGANRDGIHYPGPHVWLSSLRPRSEVQVAVHDAVAFPNPLVVRRHEITLSPKAGALDVTESMLIDNPRSACYVGRSAGGDGEPVTLQLAIPGSFERVTFASEFFGRRFAVRGGKLVTGVPWPPGQREVKFSYVLPMTQRHGIWQRFLDLPSEHVRVSVRGIDLNETTCSLSSAPRADDGAIAFETGEQALPAGYPLRVELGHLPISVMSYGPGIALAVLAGLVISVFVGMGVPKTKSREVKRHAESL